MELQQRLEESLFLCVIGIITVVYLCGKAAYSLTSFAYIYFTDSKVNYKSFGKWALVTGSGDGIGKSLALELAKNGVNIILISLYPDELDRVAEEIRHKYDVETRCVTFDFTTADDSPVDDNTSSVYDVIYDAINELEIGILINNVGTNYVGEFLDTAKDGKRPLNIINCNVNSTVKMTQLILAQMLTRKKGLVINISSLSASSIGILLAVYASTKRYVDTFSKCLSYEYRNNGIIIMSVQPGMVSTNATKGLGDGAVPHHVYAQHLLKTVGKADMTFGYWKHALEALIIKKLPDKVMIRKMKEIKEKYSQRENTQK